MALARAVAGLAFSAAKVFVTCPGAATPIWMFMDVVGLKDSANVRFIRLPLMEALDGRFLVTESSQEGEGELLVFECLLGQGGNGLFYLNRIHSYRSRYVA